MTHIENGLECGDGKRCFEYLKAKLEYDMHCILYSVSNIFDTHMCSKNTILTMNNKKIS